LEYSKKTFFLFKDIFDQKHRSKERRDKEQKTLLSIECLASKKKKNCSERHWLFIQITDEPLVQSHLGLRLQTRICSWSAGEGCVFTRGRLGEEVWGSEGRELPEFLAEVYPRQKSIKCLRSSGLKNP